METGFTFEAIVTPGGALVAATAIKLLVDLLKAVVPRIDAAVSGALLAFIASGALYLAAAVALPSLGVVLDANGYLNVGLTWLTCASTAIGITSAIRHATSTNENRPKVLIVDPVTNAIKPPE